MGSLFGWSGKYSFRTIPNEDRDTFAVYGDLGVVNAQSLARLQREAQMDYYDAILHVGDFAYGTYGHLVEQKPAFFYQILLLLDMDADQVKEGPTLASHIFIVCLNRVEWVINL